MKTKKLTISLLKGMLEFIKHTDATTWAKFNNTTGGLYPIGYAIRLLINGDKVYFEEITPEAKTILFSLRCTYKNINRGYDENQGFFYNFTK